MSTDRYVTMRITGCPYWDSGWCYKKDTKYTNGCVGVKECCYVKKGDKSNGY